jgi:hypothetical protein
MADDFQYDVFLSHSSKDKAVVRDVANRLRDDGLTVWFDEWELKPGDNIPAKIEDGLERSHVLVLCMSANSFGSEWAQLESGTFRFRDPLNKDRRFIPLRLDEAPIKGSLAQLLYLNWLPEVREQEYMKLREACFPPERTAGVERQAAGRQVAETAIKLDYLVLIRDYAFSPDGKRALTGADDATARLWDLETGRCLRVLDGHMQDVWTLAWSANQRHALSASNDGTVRLWDLETGRCLRVLEGHRAAVYGVAWRADERHALSGSADQTIRLWDVEDGRQLRVFEGHTRAVVCVALSADHRRAVSGSWDSTVRLWDLETGRCLRVLEGHSKSVACVTWSFDQRHALSGSDDFTVRVW